MSYAYSNGRDYVYVYNSEKTKIGDYDIILKVQSNGFSVSGIAEGSGFLPTMFFNWKMQLKPCKVRYYYI